MKLTAEQQRKAEENMGLVGKVIADKVHGTYFGSYTREDLFQIGCIGLCKAAATDKGGCFSTYAYRLIWNEICTALISATRKASGEQPTELPILEIQGAKESLLHPGTGGPAGERGTGGHRGGEEGHPGHAAPGERILHPGDRCSPGRAGQLCHRLGGQGPEIPAGYELGVWRPNSVFFSTSSTVSSRFISCRTADTPNRKFSI